jgi:hypothetical protein
LLQQGSTNPRILIMGKTLISNCHFLMPAPPQDGATARKPVNRLGPKHNAHGLVIDTLSNEDKTEFVKFNPNEMYPDHVLVYRDLEGPKDDHSSRLTLKHCQVSYRSGTRYNPQEQEFNPDEIKVISPDSREEVNTPSSSKLKKK